MGANITLGGFPGGKESTYSAGVIGDFVLSLGQQDPLEEGQATHSSISAWRILWTKKPGRLQSMGSQIVGHDWSDLACMHTLHCVSKLFSYSVSKILFFYCFSVAQVCLTPCDTLGVQQTRPLHPSPSPKVFPSSCSLHWWCHLAISSFDALFPFWPQSFPTSGTFPTSQLFTSDEQNTGVSASASVLPTIFRADFPWDWLVLSRCHPRGYQESSPAP